MLFLTFLPAILCCLALAAHFLHGGDGVMVLVALLAAVLLLIRKRWARIALQVVLVLAVLEWLGTAEDIRRQRIEVGREWFRAVAILVGVALFNILAAILLQMPRSRRWFTRS
jgi:hypothetical protein